MNPKPDYRQFLESKIRLAPSLGFEVDPAEVNPALKDFVRAIIPWAAKGGRRGIFSSFGLHKTSVQLELARLAMKRGLGPALIVLPLGVRQEFFEEAAIRFTGEHAVRLKFIRSTEEIEGSGVEGHASLPGLQAEANSQELAAEGVCAQMDLQAPAGTQALPPFIHLTNYESVRDGKLDVSRFGFASLDEAAVLRGFGGTKTFREFMRVFASVPLRFVATATPDPNEFIELLAYAAFLDIMDVGEAKTRFFKRDSEKADTLTLHPHKEREFWLWVSSWALFLNKPSDLGFSDDGYIRPELDIRWHEVPTDHASAGAERDGQGRMFKNAALGVTEASKEKRDTIGKRVERLLEIINGERSGLSASIPAEEPGEGQRCEPRALRQEQGCLQEEVQGVEGGQPGAHEGAANEASAGERRQAEAEKQALVSEQQTACSGAIAEAEAQEVRADAGRLQSAAKEAERRVCDLPRAAASEEEPQGGSLPQDGSGAGLALSEVQHGDRASVRGSRYDHASSGLPDQLIVWCDLNDEQRAIDKALTDAGLSITSLYGNQDIDEREELLRQWKAKQTSAFVSKPVMYGAGLNMQQCHTMIFAGIGFKFHDLVQAVHRCHRFGQKHRVTVHLIYTEAEREVRRKLERRWRQHVEQAERMAEIIREFGLGHASLATTLQRSIGVNRREAEGEGYRLINADCVEETARLETGSVDLIVTSIPFSTQYEYTPSYNDFGHSDSDAEFWAQMDFLTPELLRVLEPGRVAAVHVKDRIVPGGITGLGFQTLNPFSDDCVAHFRKHGFAFIGRKTIVTDVVRENNQTYRLGWTEQCKDGSRMGCGVPEYLLIFRKPPSDNSSGYADVPVVKAKPLCDDHGEPAPFDKRTNWKRPVPGTGYSRARWQMDAHGFTRSSGDRLLSSAELLKLPHEALYKLWRDRSTHQVYDFGGHVGVAEEMDRGERLPSTFMLFPPHSWHPDVWTDVARMRSLNTFQAVKGKEQHLCPLPFDIVERCIVQFSMEGETVFDPFAGIGTTPYCAVKLKRLGLGIELSPDYFPDAAFHCDAIAKKISVPSLFELLGVEAEDGEVEAA